MRIHPLKSDMLLALCSVVLASVSVGLGQNVPKKHLRLADYLANHPWDVKEKGPLLVVDSAQVSGMDDQHGFAGFNRQTVKSGSLTAVVPTTMVLLDANFQDPPNIYDGLPQKDKILYLMSTLTDDQWKAASAGGIGLSDLSRDQALVFRSILPETLGWCDETAGKPIVISDQSEQTLPQEQMNQVRLSLSRQVSIGVHPRDNPQASTSVDTSVGDRLPAGSHYLVRSDTFLHRDDSLFGHRVKQTVPNALKPSDLDYGRSDLRKSIDLASADTIDDLLSEVASRAGISLMADARVGKLPVVIFGKSCTCGDLVKAMALAVTGTYRHLGAGYELTSDLEGIGARQAKIALWMADVETGLQTRRADWRRRIGKSKGLRAVGYDPSDPLAPNDRMNRWLTSHSGAQDDFSLSFNDLSPAWRDVVNRAATTQQVSPDRMSLSESLAWQFVLPSGDKLGLGGESINDFKSADPGPRAEPTDEPTPIKLDAGNRLAVCLRALSVQDAERAVMLAAGHGFSELWLQTERRDCLDSAVMAAKAARIQVRLYLRPWEILAKDSPVPRDLSLLGENSSQVKQRLEASHAAQAFFTSRGVSITGSTDLRCPVSANLWTWLAPLAGISTVVAGTLPLGYEPQSEPTRSYDSYDHAIYAVANLGYSAIARSEFLQRESVDPIDLPSHAFFSSRIDLSLPFFPDSGAERESSEWVRFTAEANRSAIAELMAGLKGPVLVETRQPLRGFPPSARLPLVAWSAGDELPSDDGRSASQFSLLRVSDSMSAQVEVSVWTQLKNAVASDPLALDLTELTTTDQVRLLEAWFTRSAARQR